MSEEISNEVLATKLDGFREIVELKFQENAECHQKVENHLVTLNGQVAKNTKFRLRAGVYIGLIAGLASTVATTITATIITKWFL